MTDFNFRNRVLLGDCLPWLVRLPSASADMVLTDPPYQVNYRSRAGQRLRNDRGGWQGLTGAFAQIGRVLRADCFCVCFYGWPAADGFFQAWRAAGLRPVAHLVFTKPYASRIGYAAGRHEVAYLLAKGRPAQPAQPPSDVLPWRYTGNRLHPTQEPLSALLPLVAAYSQPGELVLDPFCGSGSSLVAAKRLGRAYLGMELEPRYCAVARRRLQAPQAR